ncbi:LacI family DNA-binding transcriptional regulator, partial [Burkholderia cenocepacia]|uniref:LacI family DNA-binding transcriptional regulator n=1 Tax=Burkholderia cenocepacia TaxID=95486 RepID=UPI0038CC0F45
MTLRDVADGANVSVSTASRILDDRTPASTTATAVRVREVAESLGYRRNLSASSLRRGATSTIGVLVPRLTDAVMALMYEALERAAHRDGRFAVVASCGSSPH